MDTITHKYCGNCGELKPLEAFTVANNRQGGRHSICRACKSEYDREYRKNNAEKRAAYHSAYWRENKETIKERFAKWYKENFEKLKTKKQEYAKRNAATLSLYRKNWQATNKEHINEYRKERARNNRTRLNLLSLVRLHKKRAKKKEIGGTFTVKQWRDLCDFYGNYCLRCGSKDKPVTIDHVLPTNQRGANSISNLQPLCGSCNSWKRDRYIDFRPDKGEYARSLEE